MPPPLPLSDQKGLRVVEFVRPPLESFRWVLGKFTYRIVWANTLKITVSVQSGEQMVHVHGRTESSSIMSRTCSTWRTAGNLLRYAATYTSNFTSRVQTWHRSSTSYTWSFKFSVSIYSDSADAMPTRRAPRVPTDIISTH